MLFLKEGHLPLKAVVFDLGSVMFDYDPDRIMKDMGYSPETIARVREVLTDTPEWDEWDRSGITQREMADVAIARAPELKEEIERYTYHWVDDCPAIRYNVDTFYRIKRNGAKTYILSNWMPECFDCFREAEPFLSDFDGEVISYQCKLNKPNPAIYKHLMELYPEIEPENTLFIDDLPANVATARSLGFNAIQLPPNGHIAEYLEMTEE